MPYTRQARRLKENTTSSSSTITSSSSSTITSSSSSSTSSSCSQVKQSPLLSKDEAALELNTSVKEIVSPVEAFERIIYNAGTVTEENNNNQITGGIKNINEEDLKVAAKDNNKAAENLDDQKNVKIPGGVHIIETVEDVTFHYKGEQMVDDISEDEELVKKDFENNYENTSLDFEETLSASDVVDSSEVEWEEVFMENVEDVVVSVTTPAKKKKLDENDFFSLPQDSSVQVFMKVGKMKDNEDGSHHAEEFDKKLAELESLSAEESGSPAKVDIADWMAEYSNAGHAAAVEMSSGYQPAPPGQEKVVVERRQGVLGMWTPHSHILHYPSQQTREEGGDEAIEEPMVKIVDCQEVEETVSVDVVTSLMDQVMEGMGDEAAGSSEVNSRGTVEGKETVRKTVLEHKEVSASAVKRSLSTVATPVSCEQLLQERYNLPPGVSLTLVTSPAYSAPAGTRWDRKVMVMETKIKKEVGAQIKKEVNPENVIDLTEDDYEDDEENTNLIARHIVSESEEVDLKDETSEKLAMTGKKIAFRGRGTGKRRGKGRKAEDRSSLLVDIAKRKSLLKKPGMLKSDSFVSNNLSLPQLRGSADVMNTGVRLLQQEYTGQVNRMKAPVRTRMPLPVPRLGLARQLKSPLEFASTRKSPVTAVTHSFRFVSPVGMDSQGHASVSGALLPFRSCHTPRRVGLLSPRGGAMLSPRLQSSHPGFVSPGMGLVSPSTGLLGRGQMTPEQPYAGVGKMSPVVLNRIHSPLRMMSPVVGEGPRAAAQDCPRKFQYSRIKEKVVPYSI